MTQSEHIGEGHASACPLPPSTPNVGGLPVPTRSLRIDDHADPAPWPSVGGCHLRAARALLDWSMLTLADASDLSLSTVRRLEESLDGSPSRSQRKAIAALQRAGIQFVSLHDGTLALGRTQHPG